MNFAQLKFPPYEWLKKLPLTEKYEFKDRVTGKSFYKNLPREYSFRLFETPISVSARFMYNEDGRGWIYFNVMKDGLIITI